MAISTHVLDAVAGRAAVGVAVALHRRGPDGWQQVAEAVTDADGRISALLTEPTPGDYRLVFDTDSYLGGQTFYPEVAVTVRIADPGQHYHVPLLLSPYAYSTYRGT